MSRTTRFYPHGGPKPHKVRESQIHNRSRAMRRWLAHARAAARRRADAQAISLGLDDWLLPNALPRVQDCLVPSPYGDDLVLIRPWWVDELRDPWEDFA